MTVLPPADDAEVAAADEAGWDAVGSAAALGAREWG